MISQLSYHLPLCLIMLGRQVVWLTHKYDRCKHMNYPVAAHFVEFGHPIHFLRYTAIEKVLLPTKRRLFECFTYY